MRKAGRFPPKQGHLQPHPHSKARQPSKKLQNGLLEPRSPLISWVNSFPSRFTNRTIFFCNALQSHECACWLLFDERQYYCYFSIFLGSSLYQRAKPPKGTVLFINLLGWGWLQGLVWEMKPASDGLTTSSKDLSLSLCNFEYCCLLDEYIIMFSAQRNQKIISGNHWNRKLINR